MTARYTEIARAEIDEICSYIARDNPEAAANVAGAIERTVAAIAKRPKLAPIVHDGKVRAKLVERFSVSHLLRDRRTRRDYQKCPKHKALTTMGAGGLT